MVHCRSRIEEAEEVAQSIRELGRQARVLQFDVSHRYETARKTNLLMLNLTVLIMALCSMPD